MVKIRKDTELKDARRMRKEWGTGEKEFGNLLDKERKQGSEHIVSRFETKGTLMSYVSVDVALGVRPMYSHLQT